MYRPGLETDAAENGRDQAEGGDELRLPQAKVQSFIAYAAPRLRQALKSGAL